MTSKKAENDMAKHFPPTHKKTPTTGFTLMFAVKVMAADEKQAMLMLENKAERLRKGWGVAEVHAEIKSK